MYLWGLDSPTQAQSIIGSCICKGPGYAQSKSCRCQRVESVDEEFFRGRFKMRWQVEILVVTLFGSWSCKQTLEHINEISAKI